MATAIYFGGRRLNVPQAVTKIDTSALSAVSPATVGVVAFIGTAVGGVPLSGLEEDADASRGAAAMERYHEGDLRIANSIAFKPSTDPAVAGGAAKTINIKVNPSTGSGVVLPDGNGVDALDLTSKDSGQFTEQVNIELFTGTNFGSKVVVLFEDAEEIFDDVGGEALFDLVYAPGANGYDSAVATLSAANLIVAAVKAEAGLTTERAADIPAPGVLSLVSDNAADGQSVTVWGTSGGSAVRETLVLNGTTPVVGAQSFDSVVACQVDEAAAGTITISDSPVTATLFTLVAAELTKGLELTTNTPAASVATVSIDTDTAVTAVLVGTSAAGAPLMEAFDLTAGATTPVVGSVVFGTITGIALGDVAAARTVSVALDAVATAHATFTTVQKTVDRFNALDGFTANALVGSATKFLMSDADYHVAPTRAPVSVHTTAGEFFGDLYEMAREVSAKSAYVNAARSPGASLPPANTTGPVFLVGGSEGVATITEWQAAFKLLEKRRYNTIVPLTNDPAVHNLLLGHLARKASDLKSEANGYVGIGTNTGDGETRSELQSQIQALNYRNVSAVAQEVNLFDPDTGEATWFPPYILAALSAGMQAGSAIAEPLTHKTFTANDIRNDQSWDVEDDKSALIDRGLMVAEKIDGIGIRWVRSVTTHLADDKLVFVEMSSNESLNTFLFEFRGGIEKEVGKRGLGNAQAGILGVAAGIAAQLIDEEKVVAVRKIQVERVGDSYPVSCEVATVDPINFIPITVHIAAQ